MPLKPAQSFTPSLTKPQIPTNLLLLQGKRGNAILLAEADWNAINETLHLLSVPGVRESIQEGMATGLDDRDREPDW